MKYSNLVLKMSLAVILFLFSLGVKAQNNYISNNKEMATELSEKYGIPKAVILAIAFVETGGGSSKGARLYNNHFGIVGKNTVTNSRYKSFSSARESYKAFCELLSRKKFYNTLKGSSNVKDWINRIAESGYSTQPTEWKRRINSVIDKYNL